MRLESEAYQDLLGGLLAEGRTVLTRLQGISMTPAIPDEATARIAPLGRKPAQVGEVLMTRTPRGLLCHRVLRVTGQSVQTWGDVCHAPDGPVARGDALGRVEALQIAGEWRDLPPRPAWQMRGRWVKYQVKKLLGMIGSRGEEGACAAVAEEGEH